MTRSSRFFSCRLATPCHLSLLRFRLLCPPHCPPPPPPRPTRLVADSRVPCRDVALRALGSTAGKLAAVAVAALLALRLLCGCQRPAPETADVENSRRLSSSGKVEETENPLALGLLADSEDDEDEPAGAEGNGGEPGRVTRRWETVVRVSAQSVRIVIGFAQVRSSPRVAPASAAIPTATRAAFSGKVK